MRTLLKKIREIALLDEPPHRLATAFSIGVFIGMSALLGVHTLIGLLIAQVFRLNKVAMLLGVYITNPWTIIPIYSFCLVVGARLLGYRDIIPDIAWAELTMKSFFADFAHLLVPFLVGTTVVGIVAAVIGFLAVRTMVTRYRNSRALQS